MTWSFCGEQRRRWRTRRPDSEVHGSSTLRAVFSLYQSVLAAAPGGLSWTTLRPAAYAGLRCSKLTCSGTSGL